MDILNLLVLGGGAAIAAGVGNAVYESAKDIRVEPKTGFKYRNADKVYVGGKSRRAGVSGQTLGQRVPQPPRKKVAPVERIAGEARGDIPNRPTDLRHRPVGRPTQYGKAGGAIGENSKFSSYATGAGVKGEQMLGKTMMAFFSKHKVPARIYHGVYFPGSKNADIDHVVVIGQAVYLIDAKLYKADTWWLEKNATVIASLRNGTKRTSMAVAYHKTKEALGSRGIVRSVRICIQSVGREESRVRRNGGVVDVATPSEMLQEILHDISVGQGLMLAHRDNAKLMRYFQGQLK